MEDEASEKLITFFRVFGSHERAGAEACTAWGAEAPEVQGVLQGEVR